jgi:hypothetical protein
VPFSSTSTEIALRPVLDAVPLPEKKVQIGVRAVGDEAFLAGHDDVLALGPERGLHRRRIRPRPRLGDRERAQPPVYHHRQQAPLLLLGAEVRERFAEVEIGRPDAARRSARLADLAQALQVRGIGHLGAAVLLGNEHPVHPEAVQRADVLPRKFTGAIVTLGARRDLVSRQRANALHELRLFRSKRNALIQTFEDGHGALCCIPASSREPRAANRRQRRVLGTQAILAGSA